MRYRIFLAITLLTIFLPSSALSVTIDVVELPQVKPAMELSDGGNLSAITWRADGKYRSYSFEYDRLNRLTSAEYYENGKATHHYNTWYEYDIMGTSCPCNAMALRTAVTSDQSIILLSPM